MKFFYHQATTDQVRASHASTPTTADTSALGERDGGRGGYWTRGPP